MTRPLILALALGLAFGAGCKKTSSGAKPEALSSAAPDGSAIPVAQVGPATEKKAPALAGDSERGKALVEKFECSRCHDGTGLAASPLEKHCITCHQEIWTDKFKAKPDKIAKWKKTVVHYLNAPNLDLSLIHI